MMSGSEIWYETFGKSSMRSKARPSHAIIDRQSLSFTEEVEATSTLALAHCATKYG
jgi:hypothetical protein